MSKVQQLQVVGTWANVQALRERLRTLQNHVLTYWEGPQAEEWRSRAKVVLPREAVEWLIAETEYYAEASKLAYLEAGRRAHAHNRRRYSMRRGMW